MSDSRAVKLDATPWVHPSPRYNTVHLLSRTLIPWLLLNSLVISCISLKILRPLTLAKMGLIWGDGSKSLRHSTQLWSAAPKRFPRRSSSALVMYMFNRRADILFQRSSETPLFLSDSVRQLNDYLKWLGR